VREYLDLESALRTPAQAAPLRDAGEADA